MVTLRIAVLFLSGVLLGVPARSQQTAPPTAGGAPTIQVDVSVVNVLCSVRDGKGRLVSDLKKSDFEIREDDEPQEIRYFSRETKLPLTIGLLVDSSVSQRRLIFQEQQAAAAFFQQVLGKKDAAFLISFNVNVELLQDITGSVDFLRQALDRIEVNSGGQTRRGPFPSTRTGGTHLYDAVYLASLEVLQTEIGRKAVVLISDGQDQGSRVSREEAIEAALKADTLVYSILFVDRSFYGYGGRGYYGDSALKEMAKQTGGRVFNIDDGRELAEAFDQISQELRNQYSLGYTPTNTARDGTYRELEVKVRRGGYDVQARRGYYAPEGD